MNVLSFVENITFTVALINIFSGLIIKYPAAELMGYAICLFAAELRGIVPRACLRSASVRA